MRLGIAELCGVMHIYISSLFGGIALMLFTVVEEGQAEDEQATDQNGQGPPFVDENRSKGRPCEAQGQLMATRLCVVLLLSSLAFEMNSRMTKKKKKKKNILQVPCCTLR
jgi:hypothetical protein